jgi:phage protein D/phage baseplate assembly protein gpV
MPQKFTPLPSIKIGGQNVSQEFMADLGEIVVDTSLYLPSMFTIEVLDKRLKWVDDSLLDIGKQVEISIQTGEEHGRAGQGGEQGLLIKGEITALEPNFSAQGDTAMLVRGYDKCHRLHRGKKIRTFLKTKDSDLASKLAGEAGLTPEVDTTTITYDYVLQNNQTNMEFLMARAERIGYQVCAAEGKLYFKKGEANLGDGPELVFAENLLSFRPCLTAAHQADKMFVRGWDPKGKKLIESQAAPSGGLNQGGMTQTGGAKTQSAFGSSAEAIVVDQPVFTADEAKALATGLSNDISREFVQAEGVCAGHPEVKAGWTVKITNVGTRFSGKYFVTSATHIYNKDGYTTNFSISGRQPNTLSHLLESGNGHGQSSGLMQGVVTAMVTNLKDPDDLGRVKVKYPWLGMPEIESDWVRIAAPMAGAERGFMYLPEVNDEVLVAFEHGDVHRPYIIGVLWSSTDKPPKKNSEAVGGDGKVNQRVLKSRSGHLVILDDTDGKEQIIIRDKTGNNEMVIDSTKKSMTIKVDGDFSVEAKGKVNIKSTQDMTLESQAGGNIKTNANLTVKAQANLSLQATGMGELKGNSVTVDGGPMATVKGGIVKIN